MGFRQVGNNQDYIIDIGQASQYRDAAPGSSFPLSVGSVGADLVALFGANWFNRADTFWSVVGTTQNQAVAGDPTNTLYATRAEDPVGTQAAAFNRASNSTQAQPANRINSVGTTYALAGDSANGVSPAANPAGLRQSVNDANSYQFYTGSQPSTGNSFSYFAEGIEGNFGAGASGVVLDLFRLERTPPTGPGTYEGSFAIDNSGLVRFNVIPEPATAAMFAIGAGFLGLISRRRSTSN